MSSQLLLLTVVVAAAVVGVVRFEVLCIGDLKQTPDTRLRYLTRPGWLALILLVIPIGGIAYLYCGKTR